MEIKESILHKVGWNHGSLVELWRNLNHRGVDRSGDLGMVGVWIEEPGFILMSLEASFGSVLGRSCGQNFMEKHPEEAVLEPESPPQ